MTPGSNVFLAAAQWLQGVVLGPVATSLAVIGVASIGLSMLSGRMNLRRGATVIVGCFILFGAASIAQGLRGAAAVTPVAGRAGARERGTSPSPPRPTFETTLPPAADPYAGASLQR